MYQVRVPKNNNAEAGYLMGYRPTNKSGALHYETKESAERVAAVAGNGAYAEEVPEDPYFLCNAVERQSRWQIELCDSKGRTEATIYAATKEEAEKRGEWLCKCLNDHAHIFTH